MRPGRILRGSVVIVGGRSVRLIEEAAACGINLNTLRSRLGSGMPLEEALSRPLAIVVGQRDRPNRFPTG